MPDDADPIDNRDWGFLAHRVLPDGRLLGVVPLTYGRARITVAPDLDPWSFITANY